MPASTGGNRSSGMASIRKTQAISLFRLRGRGLDRLSTLIPLKSLLQLGCLLLALVVSSPLWAPPLPPPAKVLQNSRNQVVVGNYLGRLDDGRYRFNVVENLRGPDVPPEEVLVRGPDWLVTWLSPGHNYLFAYTSYIRNPRFRKDVLIDTDGPRLIDGPGLEPALFLDSPELRSELMHAFDQETLHSEAFLRQVIAGLGSNDTQLQNFYAIEVSLLAELGKRQDAALVKAIQTLLENPDGHAAARAALLRLVAADEQVYSRKYLAAVVQRLLQQAPLTGYQDLRPRSGELVAAALQLTMMHKLPIDLGALERLVGCDSAALAEAALLAIRATDPTHERAAALKVLKQTQLAATSREFLIDHLRRLDLSVGRSMQSEPQS